MSDRDIVEEAREILAEPTMEPFLFGVTRDTFRALADEVERLRRGDFTPQEFQNLCHNTDVQKGFDAFADGCEAYQKQLFGRCRKGSTT